MADTFLLLCLRALVFAQKVKSENGQDLVEYALVIAVICLAVVSGTDMLADGINTAMMTLAAKLNTAVA